MNLPPSRHDAQMRSRCAVLAARLAAQRPAAAWSLLLSAVSVFALTAAACGLAMPDGALSLTAFAFGVLLGLVERYLALRLCLDEGLFESLARGDVSDLAMLDDALTWLGLRASPPGGTRPLDARLRGTQALMRRHLGIALLQSFCVLIALIAGLP